MEWNRILLNDLPADFLLEVIFRSAVMFISLLTILRLAGKRGVKQLSVFEMVIIISLGSAAGDPMFYEDVGLLPALVVFIVVILLYRVVTWLTGKNTWFERLIEGKTIILIEDGKFALDKFQKESLAQDEFFTELRLKNVEHLGQVKNAFLETTGDISVFYYNEDQVQPGLPIIPKLFNKKNKVIPKAGLFSCTHCGHTEQKEPGRATCKNCENDCWVEAIATKRII